MIDQMDLTDIYRIFHLVTVHYTFFSESFSQINILGYKASFNKCKKTPVTSCILSDYIGIKHNINSKKATENIQTQRLKNVLRDQWSLKK
jgi:uncharacterized membrane protein